MNLSVSISRSQESNKNNPLFNSSYIEPIAKFFEPSDLISYFSLCKDSRLIGGGNFGEEVLWGMFVDKKSIIYRKEYTAKENFRRNPFVRLKRYFTVGQYSEMFECFSKDYKDRVIPWKNLITSNYMSQYIINNQDQELLFLFIMIRVLRIDSYHNIIDKIIIRPANNKSSKELKMSGLYDKFKEAIEIKKAKEAKEVDHHAENIEESETINLGQINLPQDYINWASAYFGEIDTGIKYNENVSVAIIVNKINLERAKSKDSRIQKLTM
jgi:hypothetical protein